MTETYSLSVVASCATSSAGSGALTVTMSYAFSGGPASAEQTTLLYLLDSGGTELDLKSGGRGATEVFTGLANVAYTVEWRDADTGAVLATGGATIACGSGGTTPPTLVLDSLSSTDETSAGNDGTATVQASGGAAPLTAEVVELSVSQAATSGQPKTFTGLPSSTYTVRVTDAASQQVEGTVTVAAYSPPVSGCMDEYASNYDPAATEEQEPSTCTYAPRWRSAWQLMSVPVPVLAGQPEAYVTAELRIGFRDGHPLAELRPLGAPLTLRATVGPDGVATFHLGPYLRPQLGVPDGAGGYRLDLNSETAYDADLYVGYELRRPTGEMLEHGYALNAAVPDAGLGEGPVLSPFTLLPLWPGFDEYLVGRMESTNMGRYGELTPYVAQDLDTVALPCPPNPLPVAWLAPGGGYGFWVFQGRTALGDAIGEGQLYREAGTGQRRYSEPGEAYQTFRASSGVFRGDDLLTGLRTLWRSPQAWAQLVPGGEWLPIIVERGARDVGRVGVARQELFVSFSLAQAEYSQGQ